MKIYIIQIPDGQTDNGILKVTSKDTELCKTYSFDVTDETEEENKQIPKTLAYAMFDFSTIINDKNNRNIVYMIFDLDVESNIRFLPIMHSFIDDTDSRVLVRYCTKNIYIAADGFSVNETTLEDTMKLIIDQLYRSEPFTLQISSDVLVNNVSKEIRFGPDIEHAKPRKRPAWLFPMKININNVCNFQTELKIYKIIQKV